MPHEPFKVGLIEDDPIMGQSIVQRLEIEGWSVQWWQTGKDAIGSSSLDQTDVIVCDIRLPDMNGEEIFCSLQKKSNLQPFIFITGYAEMDQAVRLMRLGAVDYLTKPFVFEEFLMRIREYTKPRRNRGALEDVTLGVSAQMREIEATIGDYAPNDLPVLILGETGVGKEVTSRLLHKRSAFADGPFMAVNCAAIPKELLESEIFGHERGAFTGADKRHHGYAERAGRGTLFLDEIGDMPLMLQAKILRLIEDRSFYRVGGETPIRFEGRIISATNKDLIKVCQDKLFREDLYYRLAVLLLDLPPLRERPEDIVCFMDKFLKAASQRQNRHFQGFSSLTEDMALDHPWKGNLRELRNRVERGVAVGRSEFILPQDMFPDRASNGNAEEAFSPLAGIRDEAERRHIERALARTEGKIIEAARLLNVSRTTLWDKMTRLGIKSERPES